MKREKPLGNGTSPNPPYIQVYADVLGLICQTHTQRSQRMWIRLLLVSDRYASFHKNGSDTLLSASKITEDLVIAQ